MKKYLILAIIISCSSFKPKEIPKPIGNDWQQCPKCKGTGVIRITSISNGFDNKSSSEDASEMRDSYNDWSKEHEKQKGLGKNSVIVDTDDMQVPCYPAETLKVKKCNGCKGVGWLNITKIEYFFVMEEYAVSPSNISWDGNSLAKIVCDNGDVYIGNWESYRPANLGLMIYKNGDIYFGNWKGYERNGYGELLLKNRVKIIGIWKDDKYIGRE